MTLERLWAGWRAAYVTSAAAATPTVDPGECLFCGLAAADPAESLVVARGELVFAVMNAYPYTSGHVMIAPLRHEAELEGLDRDESAAVMTMTQHAVVALKSAYAPDGVNLGANIGRPAGAGVPGHVHVHALPRWNGDTNFMTTVAETRVLPEDLRTSWQRLRAAWPGSVAG
jgi:diadenosine tetraphosphate (Ap4A) HIT family hydrolase